MAFGLFEEMELLIRSHEKMRPLNWNFVQATFADQHVIIYELEATQTIGGQSIPASQIRLRN